MNAELSARGDSLAGNRRGVSDVVGYVVVFTLVVCSVISLAGVGTSEVADQQRAAQLAGVERAMTAFDQDLERTSFGAIHQTTPVPPSDGEMTVSSTTTLTIERVDATGQRVGKRTRWQLGALTYTDDETTVGYDAGVRFRADAGATAVHDTPSVVATRGEPARVVVPVVVFRPAGSIDGQTDAAITVSTTAVRTRLVAFPAPSEGAHATRLRVDSPRAAGWQRAFRAADGLVVSEHTNTTVVAHAPGDTAVFCRVTVVSVRLTPAEA